jgi:hypothetical protein
MRPFFFFASVMLFFLPSCMEPMPARPPGLNQHRPSLRPEAPKLRRLDNGHYRVRKPWTVHLNGRTYHVQRGYTSNGITAPPAIKSNLGDGIQYPETWAAVFHDWLFTQPGMNRATADRLFYDLLRAYGVPENKARLMYTTVSAYSARKQGN